jgi:hypothetical protein
MKIAIEFLTLLERAIGTHPCPDVAAPRRTIAPKVREDNLDGMLMTIGVRSNKEKTSLIQCYLI